MSFGNPFILMKLHIIFYLQLCYSRFSCGQDLTTYFSLSKSKQTNKKQANKHTQYRPILYQIAPVSFKTLMQSTLICSQPF